MFVDIEILSIHATYTDIDNVGYNINIETQYLTDAMKLFSNQIKYKI